MIKHTVTVTSRLSSSGGGASSASPRSPASASASSTSTSSRREDRKRSSQHDISPSSNSKKATDTDNVKKEIPNASSSSTTVTESTTASIDTGGEASPRSPQPGPSGLQNNQNSSLNAPDLQLDCLSSDTEEEEDVTVVKISRRRKGTAKNGGQRWHNSTTTINAPPGSVVEVDLTQESDHHEDEDDDIRVDAIRTRASEAGLGGGGSSGGLKLRQFATAPHLPPNVQSRGSTPSTTPAPSVHVWPPAEAGPSGSSTSTSTTAGAAAGGPSNSDQQAYMEPHCHSHPCNGECAGMFHSAHSHLRDDYRPRRLCQPYSHHHRLACQDAHCRAHRVGPLAGMAYPNMVMDQPLDYRTSSGGPVPSAAATSNNAAGTSASATSGGSTSTSGHSESPPRDQRLISAVWRMQHHPRASSRLHPRHQRLWHECQYQQELRRRHMSSASGSASSSSSAAAAAATGTSGAAGPAYPPTHSIPPPPEYHMPPVVPYPLPRDHGPMHHHALSGMYGRYIDGTYRWHPHSNFAPVPTPADAPVQRAAGAAVAASMAAMGMYPFLLQPVGAVPGNEAYIRAMEQRRAEANSRGASKRCIEQNTFPHKFKPFSREKKEETDEKDEVDKCTICLCGK